MIKSSIDSNHKVVPSTSSVGKYTPPHRRAGSPNFLNASLVNSKGSHALIMNETKLTLSIKNSKNYNNLVNLLENYSRQFNAIHINCFYFKLAKLTMCNPDLNPKILNELNPLTLKKISEFSPGQLCNLSWSIGKIAQCSTALRKSLSSLSENVSRTFLVGKMWKKIQVKEMALLLEGLSEIGVEKQKLQIANKIKGTLRDRPNLISDPNTSPGHLSWLALGLNHNRVLDKETFSLIIESFLDKDGINQATNAEMITFLKCLVAKNTVEEDIYNLILDNMIECRLMGDGASSQYLVAVARCFADIRYDHPKLMEILFECSHKDNIRNLNDFDLPNLALILAELAPEKSFNSIVTILDEMESRWHSPESRLGVDNFIQASWALSCSTPKDKQSFFNALAFTFTLAMELVNTLNQSDEFQLYQMATLANRKDIIIHLMAIPNLFELGGEVKIRETLQIASLKLGGLASKVSLRKNIYGLAVDLFLENIFVEGKPVIIQLKNSSHLTRSGKDTGSALLRSKYLRQLGYHLITDPMNDPTIKDILQELPHLQACWEIPH